MFRSIGVIIVIWGVATFLPSAFTALERAAIATLNTIETAALVSQAELNSL